MRRRTLLGELSAEFLGTFVILIFRDRRGRPGCVLWGQVRQLHRDPVRLGLGGRAGDLRRRRHQCRGPQSGGDAGVRGAPRFAWEKVVPYWTAQIAGPLVAAPVMYFTYRGCSITLLRLDDEFIRDWDASVNTPGLRWGHKPCSIRQIRLRSRHPWRRQALSSGPRVAEPHVGSCVRATRRILASTSGTSRCDRTHRKEN